VGARNYSIDFSTLWIVPAWHERHCIIPDGFRKGTAWRHYDWQLWITVNHYRVKPDAVAFDDEGYPTRSAAFQNRRSQCVACQKVGKGPFAAVMTCGEAVGPTLFAGWAEGGEVYRCEDHGCSCGWTYAYDAGEAMGMPWPTPLIQLLATSEDQVDNVYRPLQAMARGPVPVGADAGPRGLHPPPERRPDRCRHLERDVTPRQPDHLRAAGRDAALHGLEQAHPRSRRRCAAVLAGMGGRSMETTNCWDPSEQSVAQRTYESKARDIFKFYEPPPADLKYTVKADRARIHRFNYEGSPHVNLASIEAEAAELMEKDPGQAERFYGNRIVAGLGSWLSRDAWDSPGAAGPVEPRTQVVVGFDGSDVDDWTGFRCETRDGYQFTPAFPDGRPMIWNPADFGGQVPRLEVAAGSTT
jgi:hypothetical protein